MTVRPRHLLGTLGLTAALVGGGATLAYAATSTSTSTPTSTPAPSSSTTAPGSSSSSMPNRHCTHGSSTS
jgi:hypothetical protein